MEKIMKKISLIDIILFVLSGILCFGTAFVFHACPAKDDGSWMLCHWAEHVVVALGAVLFFLSAFRIFMVDNKMKAGISVSFIPLSIATLLVPGVLVKLCMMASMRCHTIMRPSVIVLCILICALSLVDTIIRLKKEK